MLNKILGTFVTRIFSSILGFFILILTTQYLGAEGRGIIGLLGVSIGIILIFTGFIGGPALVYLTPRKNLLQLLIPSYLWAFLVCIVGTLFLMTSQLVPENLISHIFLISFISAISNINLMILIGKEKINSNNIISLIQTVANFLTLVFLFLVINRPNLLSYIVSLYVTNLISLILGFYILRKFVTFSRLDSKMDSSVVRDLLKFGFLAQIGNVIQYLNYRLSFYILNFYTGIAAVGIYSVGVSLSEALWLASSSISLVQYSKISNTNDLNYSRELTVRLAKFSFIITAFMVILILFIPANLFGIIFGKDFSPVRNIMFALSAGIASFGLTVIISHYFAGIGRYHINVTASLLGLIGTVIFNLLLVPKYGYIGAGIAASISYLISSFFLIWKFVTETKTSLLEFRISENDIIFISNTIKQYLNRGK